MAETGPLSRQSGADLIAAERQRQVEQEGWTLEHDDHHVDGELAMAAACYAAPSRVYVEVERLNGRAFIDPWPFPPIPGERYAGDWDRRKNGPLGNGNVVQPMPTAGEVRIDFLVKAGALIAAEIDRLQREADRG